MAFFATSDSFSLNSFSSMMLCSAMTPALAVILNGVRDIQLLVHLAQLRDQRVHQLLSGAARQVDKASDLGITPGRLGISGVKFDDLGQVHGIGRAVDDVAAGICGARFVRHGVHNAQKRVGERHAGQALRVVHGIAGSHIAVVGFFRFSWMSLMACSARGSV